MAINLWAAGGRPTAYNPLPPGTVNFLSLTFAADYVISLQAMSPSGAVLNIYKANAGINQNITLEKDFKEYQYEIKNGTPSAFYLQDINAKGDIVVKDIKLVEKGYGKATINGLEGFGTVKPGFTGKLSAKADFKGKVSGSMVQNPHRASHSTVETTLKSPSFFTFEPPQANYASAMVLDNDKYNASRTQTGVIAQQLFSFDIIAQVEKEIGVIPASDKAGKIAWLTNNVNKISADWYGYGGNSSGYKATFRLWFYGANAWGATTATHTSNVVAPLNRSISTDIGNTIGPDGIVHAIAYAEPSDGITSSSSISTDYISLAIEMKQAAIIDSKWTFHPNTTLINDDSFKLDATNSFQQATLWVDVLPGTTYIWAMEQVNRQYVYSHEYDVNGNKVKDVLFTTMGGLGMTTRTFTTGPVTRKLMFNLLNSTTDIGTYVFTRPMFNMGGVPAPYSKKTGDRMALPVVAGKNLLDYRLQRLNGSQVFFNGEYFTKTNNSGFDGYYDMPVKEGEKYTFSCTGYAAVSTSLARMSIACMTGSTIVTASEIVFTNNFTPTRKSVSMTVPAGATFLRIYVIADKGTAFFKDLQLERGLTPATPYEPYRLRMNATAVRSPGKNLVDANKYVLSSTSVTVEEETEDYIQVRTAGNASGLNYPLGKLKPNTVYAVQAMNEIVTTVDDPMNMRVWNRTKMAYVYSTLSGMSIAASDGKKMVTGSFNSGAISPDDEIELWVTQSVAVSSDNPFRYKIYKKFLQVEEGSVVTPVESYKLENRPSLFTKNLFNKETVTAGHFVNTGNGIISVSGLGQSSSDFIPVVGSTTYVGTGIKSAAGSSGGIGLAYYSQEKTYVGGLSYDAGKSLGTFTPPSNAKFVRITFMGIDIESVQVEKGAIATPLAPYGMATKPGRNGLELDGIDDYVQMQGAVREPSYPFTIEAAVTYDSFPIINTSLFGNAAIDLRVDELGRDTNKVNLVKYGVIDQRLVIPFILQKGVRYVFKAVQDRTNVKYYIDGQYIGLVTHDSVYNSFYYTNGVVTAPNDYKFSMGKGGNSVSNKVKGRLEYAKFYDNQSAIIDIDFTDPNAYKGTTVTDKNGLVAGIGGNPKQLNKLAKR
jgi:hypothetical protein